MTTTTVEARFSLDVDPESLRSAAERWGDAARTLEARGKLVSQAPLEVACTWTGGGADKVKAEMTALGKKVTALATTSTSTAKALEKLATTYEEAVLEVADLNSRWESAQEAYDEAVDDATRRHRAATDVAGEDEQTPLADMLKRTAESAAEASRTLSRSKLVTEFADLRADLLRSTRATCRELVALQPLDARDLDLALPVVDLYGNLLRYSFKPGAKMAAADGLTLLTAALTLPTADEMDAFTTFGLTVPEGYQRDAARGAALLDELAARVEAAGDLPPDAAMAQVEKWVASLSDADKITLTLADPRTVGSTPGVPVELRYAANRINVTAALEELAKARAAAAVLPDRFRSVVSDPVEIIDGQIAMLEKLLADDRQVLTFEATQFDTTGRLTQQPKIAVVTGDLTTAEYVTLLVGGVGTNLANFDSQINRTAEFAGKDAAAIAWYQYEAPQLDVSGVSALAQKRAEEGGNALFEFSQSFRTPSAEGDVTYMGHSYGSLVLAHAIRAGLDVDRAVFVGSPGVGQDIRHADGLGAPAHTKMYAMSHPGDPISDSSWHGYDPAETPGFTPLLDDGKRTGLDAHQGYFRSKTLKNLVTVSRGKNPATLPEAEHVTEGGKRERTLSFLARTGAVVGKSDDAATRSPSRLRDDAPGHVLDGMAATRDWTGDRYGDAKKVLRSSARFRLLNVRIQW